MATVALSGIITPTNVVTATSTTTLTNKTLTGAVVNGTVGATTPSTGAFTTVTTTGSVGVGTASPTNILDVASSDGTNYAATSASNSSPLGGTNAYLTNTANGGFATLKFQSTNSSAAIGYFGFYNTSGSFTGDFVWGQRTGSTSYAEQARIPSTGGFQSVNSISVGNATPSSSGAGITFPATQSASTDANTLDDYEEGTWTPTATNVTITSVVGTYTKIGRYVYITCKAVWPTTANTSAPVIQGLPFTSKTQSGGSGGASIAYNGSNTDFYALVNSNSTNIDFYQKLGAQPVNANFSTYEINFSISYLV